MTTSEMESEVASLMAERARLSRLNLELPPDRLMLLKRLLYRLGWTRMKLNKKSLSLVKRYAKMLGYNHGSFVRRIAENPKEATPSLVYADWLEENGMPTFASIIRHHIVRHKNTQGPHVWIPGRERFHDLENREPYLPVGHVDPFIVTGHDPNRGRQLIYVDQSMGVGKQAYGHYFSQYVDSPEEARDLLKKLRDEGMEVDTKNLTLPIDEPQQMRRYAKRKASPSGLVLHAAQAIDTPLESTALLSFADRLAEEFPGHPVTQPFLSWVQGKEGSWKELEPYIKGTPYTSRTGGALQRESGLYYHEISPKEFNDQTKSMPIFHKNYNKNHWRMMKATPSTRSFTDNGSYRLAHRKPLSSVEVANELLRVGGPSQLVHTVIASRSFHPERDFAKRREFSRIKSILHHRYAKYQGLINKPKKYARLVLSSPRKIEGMRLVRVHNYLDESGKKLGEIKLSIKDEGKRLHIEWLGPKGISAGDVANTVGPGAIRGLLRDLKGYYPNVETITGDRAGGFRKNPDQRRGSSIWTIRVDKLSRKYSKYQGLTRKAFSIVTPRGMTPHYKNAIIKVSEYRPIRTVISGPNPRNTFRWAWKRTLSSHPTLADMQQHHGKGIHRSDQVQGYELTPHEIWAHTNGKEGEAPPAPEQDWRPNEMSPEDYYSFSRLPKRVVRYAKVDGHEPAHPLVEGFPIEHALRHLANDPKNPSSLRNIAKSALTGKGHEGQPVDVPSSLWVLNDALQEANHPAYKWYNWMSAADKVGLDQHTHQALKEEGNDVKRHVYPTHHNMFSPGAMAYTASAAIYNKKAGNVRNRYLTNIRNRISQLSPHTDEKMIDESIRRHAHRFRMDALRKAGVNDEEIDKSKGPFVENPNADHRINANEKATRYSRLPKKVVKYGRGNFLDALRRIRSTNQQSLHVAADKVARKLGLHPTKLFDALHDSPRGSTPGLVQAVYGNASPEQIHTAASWIGLTGNLPGVGVFHPRPNGPDTLYRFRQNGSGMDIRDKLDRFGIRSRILMPHRNGFDVLVPDKGSIQTKLVRNYLSTNKITSEVSKGHFHTMGSQNQAQSRDMFRKTVVKAENQKMNRLRKMRSGEVKRYGAIAEFFKKIRENREERTNGLVFADWLADHDKPYHGEVIKKDITDYGNVGVPGSGIRTSSNDEGKSLININPHGYDPWTQQPPDSYTIQLHMTTGLPLHSVSPNSHQSFAAMSLSKEEARRIADGLIREGAEMNPDDWGYELLREHTGNPIPGAPKRLTRTI